MGDSFLLREVSDLKGLLMNRIFGNSSVRSIVPGFFDVVLAAVPLKWFAAFLAIVVVEGGYYRNLRMTLFGSLLPGVLLMLMLRVLQWTMVFCLLGLISDVRMCGGLTGCVFASVLGFVIQQQRTFLSLWEACYGWRIPWRFAGCCLLRCNCCWRNFALPVLPDASGNFGSSLLGSLASGLLQEAWWMLGLSFCSSFWVVAVFQLLVWAIVFKFFAVANAAGCSFVPVRKLQLMMGLLVFSSVLEVGGLMGLVFFVFCSVLLLSVTVLRLTATKDSPMA
ncbi:hypothetical protein Ancab_010642 [Ancistrocladus abbreviatus]